MTYIRLDLFGGPTSQVLDAVNIDIIAVEGVRADVRNLPFADATVDEIVVSGPQASFLAESARVLKAGGRLYINSSQRNLFGKLPNAQTLQQLRLLVIQENGPLDARFTNYKFYRSSPRLDGSVEIPSGSVRTTILEKI